MINRTLKMTFWVGYDHLGKLLLLDLICAALLCAPLFVLPYFRHMGLTGSVLAVCTLLSMVVVIAPVLAVGLAHFIKELIETQDAPLATCLTGIRLYGVRVILLAVAYTAALICLVVSIWFYITQFPALLSGELPRTPILWGGYLLGALACWGAIFVAITAVVAVPALVQKKQGLWPTIRLCAALVIDNAVFFTALTLFLTTVGVLVFLLMPPLVILLFVPLMVAVSAAYEELARKYVVREAHALPLDDSCDDYQNRGFRDIFLPWK
jgi:hypothetical protein